MAGGVPAGVQHSVLGEVPAVTLRINYLDGAYEDLIDVRLHTVYLRENGSAKPEIVIHFTNLPARWISLTNISNISSISGGS